MTRSSQHKIAACGLLFLLACAVFSGILGHGFINYDDQQYVTENVHVATGLSPANLAWAFTTGHAANWHPVTWLSHQLDVQLFGLEPRGHHLVSLVLHALNGCLLFLVLSRLTGAFWRSLAVAAIFAVHPVHVESVAWVAERKDVLAAFFGLLTLWGYAWYLEKPGVGRYALLLLSFALGLMSKPMLVTLPLLLLLLDFWPLNRWRPAGWAAVPAALPAGRLILEKLPLLALALASSVVTLLVQEKGEAVHTLEVTPLSFRIGNALVSYLRYLGKLAWPQDLSVLYPLPKEIPPLYSAGSALALVAISAWVLYLARRRPYLPVGWFWFLGMLVPVIGLVSVGLQSMADRYLYLPMMGILVAAVWGVAQLAETRHALGKPLVAGAALLVAGYGAAAWSYAEMWQDGATLFSHAVSVTGDNYYARYLLGNTYYQEQRFDEALSEYQAALKLEPRLADAYINSAIIYAKRGNLEPAVQNFNAALKLKPNSVPLHYNLALSYQNQGKPQEAMAHYRQVLQLEPSHVQSLVNLGVVLLALKRVDEARQQFSEALRLDPNQEAARQGLSACQGQTGKQ